MEHLQSFIKDCDRKIQIAKKRLEETQDDHEKVPEVCSLHFFSKAYYPSSLFLDKFAVDPPV